MSDKKPPEVKQWELGCCDPHNPTSITWKHIYCVNDDGEQAKYQFVTAGYSNVVVRERV